MTTSHPTPKAATTARLDACIEHQLSECIVMLGLVLCEDNIQQRLRDRIAKRINEASAALAEQAVATDEVSEATLARLREVNPGLVGDKAVEFAHFMAELWKCPPSFAAHHSITDKELEAARTALKGAVGHIEHMAAWIGEQKAGYSFEALGEDMPEIRATLARGETA